jgi:hypothetical protein
LAQKKRGRTRARSTSTAGETRPGTWKMDPEQLQQHLLLKNRARMIPDKKKQHDRRACRNTNRQAFRPSTGSLLRQPGISAHDSARQCTTVPVDVAGGTCGPDPDDTAATSVTSVRAVTVVTAVTTFGTVTTVTTVTTPRTFTTVTVVAAGRVCPGEKQLCYAAWHNGKWQGHISSRGTRGISGASGISGVSRVEYDQWESSGQRERWRLGRLTAPAATGRGR